jgi:hypothetical protein
MTDSVPEMAISQARAYFFVEEEGAPDAFAREGWRGAALDRDRYGIHRMPRELWEAIYTVMSENICFVCGYAPVDQPEPPRVAVNTGWDEFAVDPNNPARVSPEWVAYDRGGSMAILAGFDVTLVGFSSGIAEKVDSILSKSGKSLRDLTREDFGHEAEWPFLATVLK